jgi:hypothetical protein
LRHQLCPAFAYKIRLVVSTGSARSGEATVPEGKVVASLKLLDSSIVPMLMGNKAVEPENGEEERDAA